VSIQIGSVRQSLPKVAQIRVHNNLLTMQTLNPILTTILTVTLILNLVQ